MDTPGLGLMPIQRDWDAVTAVPDTLQSLVSPESYLIYYGFMRPSFREFYFDDSNTYEVEVIDTWEMTSQKAGRYQGKFKIELPGKEYMAVRIRKVSAA